jgi:hypothetical protein
MEPSGLKARKWKYTAGQAISPKGQNMLIVGVVTYVCPSDVMIGMLHTEGGFGCVLIMCVTRPIQKNMYDYPPVCGLH